MRVFDELKSSQWGCASKPSTNLALLSIKGLTKVLGRKKTWDKESPIIHCKQKGH